MESYQRAVYDYWIEHPRRKTIVTVSPRQVGKSILLEILLVAASLQEPNSTSIAISPIFSQSRKLYEDISRFAQPVLAKANNSLLELKFINGSTVKFASAEQGDNLRGFTVKKSGICVIDEAVWIKESFFYDVCLPFCNVYGGDIFLFSTPRTKSGLFYDLYVQGKSDDESVMAFNWTDWDLSRFLTPEILELYRTRLPRLTFQCEYLAQFVDGQGTVFPDFKSCVGEYTIKNLDLSPLMMTIDWGTGSGNDDTAITYSQIFENKICVSHQKYFNDKTPTETIRWIVDEVKSYVKQGHKEINIVVEKNSIGDIYYHNLIEALDEYETKYNNSCSWRDEITISCSTVVTSNLSKKKGVERLETLFEQKKIVIPNDNKLLTQLSLFEAKIKPDTGTVFYAGAGSSHDDCVMSLLFAVNELYNKLD